MWPLLLLLPLPLVVPAAVVSPPNAQNLTVVSLRPYNQSADLTNKDSADAAGDLSGLRSPDGGRMYVTAAAVSH